MELEEIARRLKIWMEGGKAGPVRMELHPTDSCNLKCIFCWRKENLKPTKKELSEDELLRIVREAAELGVMEWIVSGGGEPLVRKNATLKVLKEIKKFGMWGLLTTNGTLMTERDARFLVKIGWDQVQFSIDGPNKEINDFLRPPNSFDRAIRAVKTLRRVRDEKNSTKPYIGFNTIINRINYTLIPDMIELAHEVGSELVFFEPIYPGYSEIDLRIPTEDTKKLKKVVRRGERIAKKLGVATNVRDFLEVQLMDKSKLRKKFLKEVEGIDGFLGVPCFRPWYLMGVKASGFSGCCSTFEIGEFIQGKSLKEVWYGKTFMKLRKEMLEKNPPYYCDKCSIVVLMENRTLREMLRRV
ncbi:MAG: radical SAM protein [Candidatus Aenigmarchaeota archaeon]|nr:radical SAM protein [Candidatus Aenigmarchaeota archaeon]